MGAADTLQGQVRQSAEAEADGFDSFWTAQVAGVDALTLLALSGGATQTIEMGTAVVPTYPRHPMPSHSRRSPRRPPRTDDCCSESDCPTGP